MTGFACAASSAVSWNTAEFIYFANGGDEEVYIGSADWMPRNLYERVEVLVPLKDPMLRERVRQEILEAYLADNLKTRILSQDGSYRRVWQTPGSKRRRSRPPGQPHSMRRNS